MSAASDSQENNETRAIKARREWLKRGRPEVARDIARMLVEGTEVPERLLNPSGNPKAGIESPPRSGKGSSVDEWRSFAVDNTDMDNEVLAKMNRDDIIEVLESQGVIEREG